MSSDALRAFKADLLARIDIVPLIERHVPLKKAGASYMACCPFHSEKTPSFSVSPAKQFYHCFGCGAHGNAIDFLVEYQGLSFIEALRALAAEVGMELPRLNRHENNPEAHRSTIVPLLEAMRNATEFYKAQLKHSPAAIDYLKKRGLTGETAMRFSLGYAPDAWEALRGAFANYAAPELVESGLVIDGEKGRRDRFHGRVIFPIFNQKNDVIAFGGRIIGPGEPKYLNSPETPLFEKGKELFGLPQARLALRRENCAIVVEGYMDVVMLHQHGIEHAVATLGTATTPAHVQKLLRQVDRIVFCFDGDNAGRKAAWRALENAMEQLVDGKTLAFAFLPEGEDPDSLVQQEGQAAFLQRMRQALPLSEYLFEHLLAEGDSNSAEGRAKLIAEARPLIERAGAPILRMQLQQRLADLSGLNAEHDPAARRVLGIGTRPARTRFTARRPALQMRKAPSLPRHVLRLVCQTPAWIVRVPLDALAEGEERTLLYAIADFAETEGVPASYAALREALRGHPQAALLDALAVEGMRLDLNPDEVAQEFEDALKQLETDSRQRQFAHLKEKAARLGVAGLTEAEKHRYTALLPLLQRGSHDL